jgi:FixJ family two-component response regulator
MPSDSPTVFVVDDDVSVREALESSIRSAGWQVEAFESARDFLSWPRAISPSCLVLDVSLPDLNGLDLQQALRAEQAHLPIIFISGQGDVPMSVRAMKAGAVEFLTKPCNDEALYEAIREALEQSKAAIAGESEIRGLRDRYASLTPRQCEVLTLVVSGLSNKQVGSELGITEITVKVHRGQVMRKMQADSLVDLVQMATRLHLTPRRSA